MLKNKIVFITGGSGSLGSSMVRQCVRDGAKVAFSYNTRPEAAGELVAEIAAMGGVGKAYAMNVLDKANLKTVVSQVEEEIGPVDVLVNNAGMSQIMPFALIEEEDWDQVMNVNVKGTFLVTKAFLRGMIRRKSGCIINMGSLAGMRILEVPVHYATAKSAIVGFSLSLAREVARFGIRVNTVVPGMINGGVGLTVPDKQRDEYCRYCTLSRPGEPDEVAQLVAFLASDRASYINAQAIFIDGGI